MKNVWAYDPKRCDGDFCPMDCDKCIKADEYLKEQAQEDEETTGKGN